MEDLLLQNSVSRIKILQSLTNNIGAVFQVNSEIYSEQTHSALKVDKIFKFRPISFSFVALHPCPKGIVQFIGGAFFGSFPTFFYEYLLKQFFLAGYTVVAFPFRFTFNHWAVATSLLREQQHLRPLLAELAHKLGYSSQIYSQQETYSWVGHSLGCKYIALLELLAEWDSDENKPRDLIQQHAKRPHYQIEEIERGLAGIKISIKDQVSVLIAPDIGDTADAIKLPFVPQILDKFGLGVLPTKIATFKFIRQSALFHLAGMASFDKDNIAGNLTSTPGPDNVVLTLFEILEPKLLHQEIEGRHLRPLGTELGSRVWGPIAPPPHDLIPLVLEFIQLLKERLLSGVPAMVQQVPHKG